MNRKYLSIILAVCLITAVCFVCTACKKNKTQNMVQYKSKYSQAAKSEDKNKQSSIINLSDGRQVNYDYRVGPGDPIGPSFNVVTVDNQ